MKLYLVTGQNGYTKWVGTQKDVADEKRNLKALGDKAEVQEIDVPTDKQGLLTFLNTGKH